DPPGRPPPARTRPCPSRQRATRRARSAPRAPPRRSGRRPRLPRARNNQAVDTPDPRIFADPLTGTCAYPRPRESALRRWRRGHRRCGDVTGTITGQERDEPGDLIRLAEPAQRNLRGREVAEELLGRHIRRPAAVNVLPLRRLDQAYVHAVDEDPFFAQFHRQ